MSAEHRGEKGVYASHNHAAAFRVKLLALDNDGLPPRETDA
ncbi:hypothetical protein CCACVL1_17052 [Corchorus capsularis]|uniref:Uncharacterized protein n=1 Tax=Corchorus capsularis TaxID=210143 RepID=A0A1R3HU73_COCAP|nr:hypothetical protein CCACVL1_17052 [Corchorus capsularis]